jgi:hypothetical protein
MKFFEDVEIGDRLELGRFTFTADDIMFAYDDAVVEQYPRQR